MAIQTKVAARQWPLEAVGSAGTSQIGAGNELIFKIPPNSFLKRVQVTGITVFDGTGAVTGTLTDGTTVFVNAQSLKAAGDVTVAVADKYYPTGATLTFSVTDANDNSTVGQALVLLTYVGLNRQNEVQE